MIKIAVYGKGGIGKSTTVSNIAAALAEKGLKVMQIGCDPKADSTISLHNGKTIPTVLDLIRTKKNDFTLEDMTIAGYAGVICVEAGGPTPGLGCAGRGIIAALEKLKEKGAYEIYKPDVIIYDVLGDVVCGGFSMPMRSGYADKVFIITSGENMSIHAAANIAVAVENFKDRGYAELGGLILNRRDVKNEEEKVTELADDINSAIIGSLDRSETVQSAEALQKTVIEAFPESEMAKQYRKLAVNIMHVCGFELKQDESDVGIRFKDACFPSPFESGLEYSAPARGVWNIVHTGMLIPEAHEIFVCASGCLRGVVLTAAEMNALDRFSSIVVRENNVLEGDMENLIIEGVTDILNKLPQRPPAVLLYTSCIHHFMGCDLKLVYSTLRERFPDVAFTDCYMNPIMRKSGLTPDEIMRKQLYSLLKKCSQNAKSVNIIGNNIATDSSSELVNVISKNGFEIKDITLCKTYRDYLSMAESAVNITYNPAAKAAGDELEKRLGQKHLYLPLCYGYKEIAENLDKLSVCLNIPKQGYTSAAERAEQALESTRKIIGNTPVAIDYTATMRPLGLARLLTGHGFTVDRIYIDGFNKEEKEDFEWLKKNNPDLKLYPTIQVKMRMLQRKCSKKMLAIGQKAAYFTGSDNFVNIVEGGGMYGFDGICRMAELMSDAYLNAKDARSLIQIKGLGCECLL